MSNSRRRQLCVSFKHRETRNTTDFLLQATGQFSEQQKVFESPIIQCYLSWLINPRGMTLCKTPVPLRYRHRKAQLQHPKGPRQTSGKRTQTPGSREPTTKDFYMKAPPAFLLPQKIHFNLLSFQVNYTSPLVAMHFTDVKKNYLVPIQCSLNGKGIINNVNSDRFLGRIIFALSIGK